MKYMGSKRSMLTNGLGDVLRNEVRQCDRVVDLFAGSAAVSWFAAASLTKRVLATDLQMYAVILARSVVQRTRPLCASELNCDWLGKTKRSRSHRTMWQDACKLGEGAINTATWVKRARELCSADDRAGVITRTYGGHYFSPVQAMTFDAMLSSLPDAPGKRDVCLAATIIAASQCAASPGHTAQPFQPTRSASRYLREAWKRDVLEYALRALQKLCPLHARVRGAARIGDAIAIASSLKASDLVFVDPPYSDVHYSRFYHVLETLARGRCGNASGRGRYPPTEERPSSAFSRKTASRKALRDLLQPLASVGCKVVFTFPQGKCSNGLSGKLIEETAQALFQVERKLVAGKFSTLGGNNDHRDARHASNELILVMRPF